MVRGGDLSPFFTNWYWALFVRIKYCTCSLALVHLGGAKRLAFGRIYVQVG